MNSGSVAFVGDGIGDPALRTGRASARLAEADRVVRAGEASVGELAALAGAGKAVVRLVAGDPLEDEAVVDEARALVALGIAIEIVPGIGARSAVAAFAGILGRALRVPAGAEAAGALASALADEPPGTPVSLVTSVGLPAQRVVVTTASDALARAAELSGAGEAGESELVVAFGQPDDALRWAERRPLFGKRVLVTRAKEQAGSAAALLRAAGADPVVVPAIEIHPPRDPAPLARALADLRAGLYPWVVFTSANGVERTWETLFAAGGDARAFGAARLAAIGPATARALAAHGLRPDVVAREFRGEILADALLAVINGEGGYPRVLLARAAKARDVLPEALREAGCAVDVVAAYETRTPPRESFDAVAGELAAGRLDAVTFTSSSTVENLCDRLGKNAAELLGRTRVASIGPVTTLTAEEHGLRVDVTARDYTVPGLLHALAESYR